MAGTQRTKRQHFVPQVYLRRFTSSRQEVDPQKMRLWTLDKLSLQVRDLRIREVASRNGFYDLSASDQEQLVEKLFAEEIEPAFATALNALLACAAGQRPIAAPLKADVAYLLTMQYLRTQGFRSFYQQQADVFLQGLRPHLQRLHPDLPLDQVRLKANIGAARHAAFFLDPATLREVPSALYQHVWCIARNITPLPFVTSDAPMVWNNLTDLPAFYGRGGFGAYGAQVLFPLTPRHLLVMTDRRYAERQGQWLQDEGRVIPGLLPLVRYANTLQMQQSDRQVFSSEDIFIRRAPGGPAPS